MSSTNWLTTEGMSTIIIITMIMTIFETLSGVAFNPVCSLQRI